jgi:hypothetical protein
MLLLTVPSFQPTTTVSCEASAHMPSHTTHVTARRLAFLLSFILFLALFSRTIFPRKMPTTGRPTSQNIVHSPLDGRWRAVRASLGLPSLSGAILIPSSTPLPPSRVISRFDLRKRKKSASRPVAEPVQLYFSSDALDEPKVSLEQLADSFRAIALAEKEAAGRKTREKVLAQRTRRRPPSWSVRKARE